MSYNEDIDPLDAYDEWRQDELSKTGIISKNIHI